MNWPDTQRAFATAVRDPSLAVPDAVGPRESQPPTARFNVYRNNSTVSLTEAMGDTYPVVKELVGEEFFTAMARGYVDQNVPESPVLIEYGSTFPEFIAAFEPAQSLPFLADVARVEWSWVQAYHAADRESISAEALQTIDPDGLNDIRFVLHPSMQLIQSDWPAVSIWSAHQIDDIESRQAELQKVAQAGEYGLLLRPEFDVSVQIIDAVAWTVLSSFHKGATLGETAAALNEDEVEHFGGVLGYIFSTGAVSAIDQD